jgi:hypothetical protein
MPIPHATALADKGKIERGRGKKCVSTAFQPAGMITRGKQTNKQTNKNRQDQKPKSWASGICGVDYLLFPCGARWAVICSYFLLVDR